MARLTYMQRRPSGIYEFRKRLPTELAGKQAPKSVREAFPELVNPKTSRFKREIVRSLGTHDPKLAKRFDLRQAAEVQGIIDDALSAITALSERASSAGSREAAPLSAADLAEIEAETLAELLAKDEEEREVGDDRRHLQTREERAQWPDLVPVREAWVRGMQDDDFLATGEAIEEFAKEFRAALAKHDPSIVRAETTEALRRHGAPIDPTSLGFHQVGMAVLRGTVRAYEAMQRRQSGEIVETPGAPKQAPLPLGPKLSEAFAMWQEGSGAAGAHKPGRSGVLEAKAAVRWFTELHSDLRLREITKAHAREYQRALARLPKRLPDGMKGLPLRRLLRRDLAGFELRGATTVNKSITMLAAIVSYAQREGLLDDVPGYVNPFGREMKLRVNKRTDEGREPFQPSDLAAIFSAGVFTEGERPRAGGGEAAFWFPLIALLSGMRLEEIAGLRLEDLRQDEETGCWLFDVTPRGGRSVKTASSIRKVPVHPELVRIGLIRYRQSLLTDTKSSRLPLSSSLWPRLKPTEGRPLSSQWSKWFGRFLRETVGIEDRRKVFHSFRHSFKRMARDAGVPEEFHDAITGHAGNGSVGKSYGKGVSLKPLLEAMAKIEAPAETRSLAWSSVVSHRGRV